MTKESYLNRFSLIIKRLEKSPATFSEIQDHLLESPEFQDYAVKSYSIRTLQRDIKDISTLFNIEIKNNRKKIKEYFISEKPDFEEDKYNQKLLDSYQIINAVNAFPDYSEYVFLDNRKPSGLAHFYTLLHAIRNKKIVEFEYHKFSLTDTTKRKIFPLSLKESKNRWYLIGIDINNDQLKLFGLDRIDYVEILSGKYKLKQRINLKSLFFNSFGIINLENSKPEKVILKSTKQQAEYIKSLPLHHSQSIVNIETDFVIFELLLHITYDFIQEILSYGKEVEVLEPIILRDKIKFQLDEMIKMYQ
jgi:proteasome accessory factor B